MSEARGILNALRISVAHSLERNRVERERIAGQQIINALSVKDLTSFQILEITKINLGTLLKLLREMEESGVLSSRVSSGNRRLYFNVVPEERHSSVDA